MSSGPSNAEPVTMASQLLDRRGDGRCGLMFEDNQWTWDEVVRESLVRCAVLQSLLDWNRPPHIGVLLENTPDYLFWLGGAALSGATVVGVNPTRRGDDLQRDITHTDCQVLVVDSSGLDLVPDTLEVPVLDVDSTDHQALLSAHAGADAPTELPSPETRFLLLFTSGSTSAPKAVPCSNGRAGMAGQRASAGFGVTNSDIAYCPMPLFHGNAILACWSVAVAVGAPVVLRRRFSASGFLDDVRRYGCTYFTYVGRTVSYVLAQPEHTTDSDSPLRLGFGTEAPPRDREEFMRRFGATLIEGYGSSESAIVITRTPDTPAGALGLPRSDMTDAVAVVNADTGEECVRGQMDNEGRLVNADQAIGELVNRNGGQGFTGYYNNAHATAARLRDGWFWSGDLAWRDVDGFFWFAGRTADWMRVDSENISGAPIAELLQRWEPVSGAVVHGVPDERTGDQVMAVLELTPGAVFDADEFGAFLQTQPDLGTKWTPRWIRVAESLAVTANNKVDGQAVRTASLEALVKGDAIWWRPDRPLVWHQLSPAEHASLLASFETNGRAALLTV